MKRFYSYLVAITAPMWLFAPDAKAGIYTDELSKCLVKSTTSVDRMIIFRWAWSALSLHPAVRASTWASAYERNEVASAGTGELFTRLITKSCKDQAVEVIRHEGHTDFGPAFNPLIEAAFTELFSDPEVMSGIIRLGKHLDGKALVKAFGGAK